MTNSPQKAFSAVIVAAAANLVMFFAKLYIGLSSNSVAVYADSLNNLLDFGVCLTALIGVAMLFKKKSESYPFGMGKTENLIEFIISVAIIVSGACFGYASFERIMYPMPVWFSAQYAIIIAATAVIKLVLAIYLKSVQKKSGSGIIKGIAADSLMDFFITLCCFISIALSDRIGYSVDGIAGIIISIIITVQGIKSAISSCAELTGKNESDICEKAKMLLESENKVDKVHSVSCHKYGNHRVFTSKIDAECESVQEIRGLLKKLEVLFKNELEAEIYISFGGSDEK